MGKRLKKLSVTVSDEGTGKVFWKFSALKALVIVLAVFLAIVAGSNLYSAHISVKKTEDFKQKALENLMKTDSLERVIGIWSFQMENLRRIAEGKAPVSPDSVSVEDGTSANAAERSLYAMEDSLLRLEFMESERAAIQRQESGRQIEGRHFFSPVKGTITEPFNLTVNHPCVEIAVSEGSMVYCALDGTVVSATLSDQSGYTIEVMHEGDIITVYKHNAKLLKRSGDKVKAGTPIAIAGSNSDLDEGSILCFELWYKGEAVDPSQYIKF